MVGKKGFKIDRQPLGINHAATKYSQRPKKEKEKSVLFSHKESERNLKEF